MTRRPTEAAFYQMCPYCKARGTSGAQGCTCPFVCDCLVARPTGSGECVTCNRQVVGLMSPDNYKAALAAYPELTGQSIDWTYRMALAAS